MSDLMEFRFNLTKSIEIDSSLSEPTVPGPVAEDAQRIWDNYFWIDHGALDPSTFNNTNSIFVNSEIGSDIQNGDENTPVRTIQKGILLSTGARRYIVLEGIFYERFVIGSSYTPPGYASINNNLVHLVAKKGTIAYIKAPEEYHPPEEFQTPWEEDLIFPIDRLLAIYWGPGTKGDYFIQADGRMRYLFPNDNESNTITPGNFVYAYQYIIDSGHGIITLPGPFESLKCLNEVQHLGFDDVAVGLQINKWPLQAGPQGEQWYDIASGQLSDARDTQPIWFSNSVGKFDFTTPQPQHQIPGTTGTSEFVRGPGYSAWVLSICRTKRHPGRFLAACVSCNQAGAEGGTNDNVNGEMIQIMKYSPGAGWELFDEWDAAPVIKFVTSAPNYTVYTNHFGVGLLAVHDKVYYLNSIPKAFGSSWSVPGEIRVSSGAEFISLTVNGETKAEDFEYFNDYYYCTVNGKLYRSINGIDDWSLVYSNDYYYLMKMAVINEVLFFSVAAGDPKAFAYSYDGTNVTIVNVAHVTDRASILGGLVFEQNGRVIITHVEDYLGGYYLGSPPPGGAGDPPYPFISFQDALCNYEKTDDGNWWHIDNIDISAKDENGIKKAGAGVTEGRGFLQ
jgi:hypothetical protein